MATLIFGKEGLVFLQLQVYIQQIDGIGTTIVQVFSLRQHRKLPQEYRITLSTILNILLLQQLAKI